MTHLSQDEQKLLAAFALLTDEQQEIVLEAIQLYARNDHRNNNAPPEQQ